MLEPVLERPVADLHESPMQLGRNARQRLEQHVHAFFLDQARHGQDDHRIADPAPSRGTVGFGRKPREIEAVIDQLDASRAARACQVIAIGRGAGDEPLAARQLLALFPVGRRPDVLGVRRAAPRQAAQQRGVARHGGRRVQEMRMQPRRRPPAARRRAPAPGRSGGCGWASGHDEIRSHSARASSYAGNGATAATPAKPRNGSAADTRAGRAAARGSRRAPRGGARRSGGAARRW